MKHKVILHRITIKYNMPYLVRKCLTYGTALSLYYEFEVGQFLALNKYATKRSPHRGKRALTQQKTPWTQFHFLGIRAGMLAVTKFVTIVHQVAKLWTFEWLKVTVQTACKSYEFKISLCVWSVDLFTCFLKQINSNAYAASVTKSFWVIFPG